MDFLRNKDIFSFYYMCDLRQTDLYNLKLIEFDFFISKTSKIKPSLIQTIMSFPWNSSWRGSTVPCDGPWGCTLRRRTSSSRPWDEPPGCLGWDECAVWSWWCSLVRSVAEGTGYCRYTSCGRVPWLSAECIAPRTLPCYQQKKRLSIKTMLQYLKKVDKLYEPSL